MVLRKVLFTLESFIDSQALSEIETEKLCGYQPGLLGGFHWVYPKTLIVKSNLISARALYKDDDETSPD